MKKRYKDMFDKERRDFLKILASAGITKQLLRASPLVWGAMYARLAEGQTTVNKSVIVYIPDGCKPTRFFPNSSLSNLTSLPMSAPYNSVRTQCNFLLNMKHHRGGHGVMQTVINNGWGTDSFDVNIGRIIGASRPFLYVNLGAITGSESITMENGDRKIMPEQNPFNAFQRLFSGSSSSTSGGTNPKLAVVDSHKEAIAALKNKLGTYEQQRLDSHLSAINAFQQRLPSSSGGSSGGSCNTGTLPGSQFAIVPENFERIAQLHAQIIALALQCNLTASASLMLGSDDGQFSMPYLNFKGVYHQSIHCCADSPDFNETRGHLSKQSAYMIQQLIDKGIIDSTILCEVSDMGDGNDHTVNNIPLIMAGGGTRLRRGVATNGNNLTPLQMLHTAATIMGATTSSTYRYNQAFGDSGTITTIPNVMV
jgi:hypothetical protein